MPGTGCAVKGDLLPQELEDACRHSPRSTFPATPTLLHSLPNPLPAVALAAAKDAFSQRMQERGNTNAKFWSAGLLEALGGERHWHQVGLRQLRWGWRRLGGVRGQVERAGWRGGGLL